MPSCLPNGQSWVHTIVARVFRNQYCYCCMDDQNQGVENLVSALHEHFFSAERLQTKYIVTFKH